MIFLISFTEKWEETVFRELICWLCAAVLRLFLYKLQREVDNMLLNIFLRGGFLVNLLCQFRSSFVNQSHRQVWSFCDQCCRWSAHFLPKLWDPQCLTATRYSMFLFKLPSRMYFLKKGDFHVKNQVLFPLQWKPYWDVFLHALIEKYNRRQTHQRNICER